MAGRVISANFPETMAPGLRKVFFDQLDRLPKQFRQWANVIVGPDPGGEAGRAYLEDLQIAGLGTAAPKPEGDPIQYDSPEEGNLVRATPYTFALGYRCTHEAKQDGRYGVFDRMTAWLARSMMHQMEVQAHRPLNNGFGTTGGTGHTATGFDSLALFSTAHTLVRGGTSANRATTDQDLSLTAIENAFDTLEGTTDESGFPAPLGAMGATLLIPYQLRWIAKEIADSELKPYTSDNEVNPVAGTFQYMVSHYLTDSDSWFLLGPKDMHSINVWLRETPTYEMGDDFDTKDTKASAMFRVATWHSDWRNVFGSAGA